MSKSKRREKIYPIYVIVGKDGYLRTQAIKEIRAVIEGEGEEFIEIRLDGSSVSLADLFDELRTPAFFGQRKLIILDEADKFISTYRAKLEGYFDHPVETNSILVIVCSSWAKNTKLAKKLPHVGKLISAEPLSFKNLTSWVIEQAKMCDKLISFQTAQELINIVGTDTGRLVNEIEKLATFVGERKEITSDDIELLCGPTAELSVFALNDAIAEKNSAKAFEILNKILENDRSAEYTLVGVIGFGLRRLLEVCTLIEQGYSENQIRSELKLYPQQSAQLIAQAKKFTKEKLIKLINLLIETDFESKVGLGRMRVNIEKFVVCAVNI